MCSTVLTSCLIVSSQLELKKTTDFSLFTNILFYMFPELLLTVVDNENGRLAVSTASREKLRGADPEISQDFGNIGPDAHDLRRASQFDLVIDKEKRLISNLRWNMPVLLQTVPNVQLSSR